MIKEKEMITVSDVTKKVKTGLGNGRGTLILAIVGISVSLASSFMFCLASIGFDFTQLQQTVFWSRWASMSISSLFAYALVILHKDEVNRLKPWYTEHLRLLADKSATAGDSFEEYLKQLNLQRRVEWYKRNLREKVARLNEKILRAELKNRPFGKLKDKLKAYQERLDEEYIETHIYVLKTRSKPISSVQVLAETQKGDKGETNFRSASAYYGGKAAGKLCLSLCMTAAFACVIVNNFEVGINVAAVAMTVLTVLSLLISVLSAVTAANGCYKNVYVPNLQFKLKIFSGYESWLASTANR